ncbi:hypothetical protein ATER59S_00979 [Aquamicrobium terrae]
MTSREQIHPVLVSRPRRFLVGSAMAAVALVTIAFGYYALAVGESVVGATEAVAQTPTTGARGKRLAANERAKATAGNPEQHNTISRQAAEWGAGTCLAQIGRVSDFLTTGQSYAALSRKGAASADESMFSATIAGADKNGLASISSFVSAPVAGDRCNSAYQTVVAFTNSCAEVREGRFHRFTTKVELGNAAESWTDGKGAYLHMLPVGDRGCVVVKTEMVF